MAAETGAAERIQRAWGRHRAGATCMICLCRGAEPPIHMGCACRGPSALAHIDCLIETARATNAHTGRGYYRCGVCHQEVQGPARTALFGAQVADTAEYPVDHPERISAIVALARETAGYKNVDPGQTFGKVLRMKQMIDRHPMAAKWATDVCVTISTCLKRMGRPEQAIAQSKIGLTSLEDAKREALRRCEAAGYPPICPHPEFVKEEIRMSVLCAINLIEVHKATEALATLEWVMDFLQPHKLTWSTGTVSVHEGPLTYWVARWMKALQTEDEAARRAAQASFAQAEATVRRVFGSSHIFTLKWIEWRQHLSSPRRWDRPPR